MGGLIMKIKDSLTLLQWKSLISLGCKMFGSGDVVKEELPNGGSQYYFIPTVDEAIDWLRTKHNIIIYDAVEPVISTGTDKVHYRLKVKWCNKHVGYNGRVYIGSTRYAPNLYSLKREAVTLAIRWLKNKKQQNKKNGRNSHN